MSSVAQNFCCVKCLYVTTRKDSLKKHVERVHDKIKDKECHLCDFRTFEQKDLSIHIKKNHLDSIGVEEYEYECVKCDYFTTHKRNFKSHKNNYHRAEHEEMLECVECGKSYHKRNGLVLHVRTVHLNIRPY